MGHLLFSPNGRIGPDAFMRGAVMLIVASVFLSLPQIIGILPAFQGVFDLLSLILLYPWIALWIKRYHDAGKSGVMCLLPIFVYIFAVIVLAVFMLGGVIGQIMQATADGAAQADIDALTEELMRPKMLPFLIASTALSWLLAFLFNRAIKRDPHDNQYGPA